MTLFINSLHDTKGRHTNFAKWSGPMQFTWAQGFHWTRGWQGSWFKIDKNKFESCLLPPARRANFPQMSPQAPHQWREEVLDVLYISWFFSHAICIADIRIHKDHGKRYQGFLPETVGAQGGMLGDGVVEFTTLREVVWTKAKGVNKPETNLLERQSKRDLVPMRICAKP